MKRTTRGAIAAIALVLGAGLAYGPFGAARAASNAPAANGAPAREPGANNQPAELGTGTDQSASKTYEEQYGPVDQSKPLDFSNQPKSVPRTYAGGKLYNVQVLKGYSYTQVVQQMGYYTQALGVSCTYCHNVQNFAYDTPTKKIARTMQLMSNGVTNAWVDPVKRDFPNYAVTGAVGCITCHRGAPHMAVRWNVVPVQYLDYRNKSTKMAGYVLNSMYSAAKSLGQNCLFCHNTADFVTLQYYPTNKIAHRMWAMVDEINHTYLPPNVKAVTCYTCHQGAPWPSELVKAGLDQSPVQAIAAHPEVHLNPGAHLASGAAR